MDIPAQQIKLTPVDANMFSAVGYGSGKRTLLIKMQNGATMQFENVPRFRFDGLMAAPRKDAYYRSFIENQFLVKQVAAPSF